uniref:Secreted protein n=1 Tax=Heterorhabditis bacteriophora TaxID=37862 RepID=A0A1I7XAL3_HETBA
MKSLPITLITLVCSTLVWVQASPLPKRDAVAIPNENTSEMAVVTSPTVDTLTVTDETGLRVKRQAGGGGCAVAAIVVEPVVVPAAALVAELAVEPAAVDVEEAAVVQISCLAEKSEKVKREALPALQENLDSIDASVESPVVERKIVTIN